MKTPNEIAELKLRNEFLKILFYIFITLVTLLFALESAKASYSRPLDSTLVENCYAISGTYHQSHMYMTSSGEVGVVKILFTEQAGSLMPAHINNNRLPQLFFYINNIQQSGYYTATTVATSILSSQTGLPTYELTVDLTGLGFNVEAGDKFTIQIANTLSDNLSPMPTGSIWGTTDTTSSYSVCYPGFEYTTSTDPIAQVEVNSIFTDTISITPLGSSPFYTNVKNRFQLNWDIQSFSPTHYYVYKDSEDENPIRIFPISQSGTQVIDLVYDSVGTFNTMIQARNTPLGIAGTTVEDIYSITITNSTVDQTTFTTSSSSILLNQDQVFTWDIQNGTKDIHDIVLDVGLDVNQPYINVTHLGESSSFTYKYTFKPFNPTVFPRLFVTYDDGTMKTYVDSFVIKDVPDSDAPYENTTIDLLDNNIYYLATQKKEYDIEEPVSFRYFLTQNPEWTDVEMKFFANIGDVDGVEVDFTPTIANTIEHLYYEEGQKTPYITISYTVDSVNYKKTLFLGGFDKPQSILLGTPILCNKYPPVTTTGVFAYCKLFRISTGLPVVDYPVNTFAYLGFYIGSVAYSFAENSIVFSSITKIINPPSGTYTTTLFSDFEDDVFIPVGSLDHAVITRPLVEDGLNQSLKFIITLTSFITIAYLLLP